MIRALLLAAALSSCSFAADRISVPKWEAGKVQRATREPGWVELVPPPAPGAIASSTAWHAVKPYDLGFRNYLTMDGEPVCVLYLEKKGTFAMVATQGVWDGEKLSMRSTTYVITVVDPDKPDPVDPDPVDPDEPDKPDTPDPVPTGIAGELYRLAVQVGMPKEHCFALADTFDGTASAIAAGGLKTVEAVNISISSNMPRLPVSVREKYKPLTSWVSNYMKKNHPTGSDVRAVETTLNEFVKGLRAVK